MNRRSFVEGGAAALASLAAGSPTRDDSLQKRIRVGVIGCGSVSGRYLPNLTASPHVELVSTCDRIPERAVKRAAEFKVPNHYPSIQEMIAGAPFDLLVNLTDMQEHEHLNRTALRAGKHVWSEKPMANSASAAAKLLELARKENLRFWGAPTVVTSPQFAFMAKTLNSGSLGPVSAAHASYGHLGPDWSAFFYERGGGSMPDLGVYNYTTLTGLLGPAKEVAAMTSIVTPTRKVHNKGEIRVEAEDNAHVMIRHSNGAISHTECGFNFFTATEHDHTDQDHHTISIIGRDGSMHLCGYDWAPHAVDLATKTKSELTKHAVGAQGYVWEWGASLAAECLATGKDLLITPEHAIHIVEVMEASRESQRTGRRVDIKTTFKWPVIS